jgi:hypothetical protein
LSLFIHNGLCVKKKPEPHGYLGIVTHDFQTEMPLVSAETIGEKINENQKIPGSLPGAAETSKNVKKRQCNNNINNLGASGVTGANPTTATKLVLHIVVKLQVVGLAPGTTI